MVSICSATLNIPHQTEPKPENHVASAPMSFVAFLSLDRKPRNYTVSATKASAACVNSNTLSVRAYTNCFVTLKHSGMSLRGRREFLKQKQRFEGEAGTSPSCGFKFRHRAHRTYQYQSRPAIVHQNANPEMAQWSHHVFLRFLKFRPETLELHSLSLVHQSFCCLHNIRVPYLAETLRA